MTDINNYIGKAIEDGESGKSVYLTQCRDAFDGDSQGTDITARLYIGKDDTFRDFPIRLPPIATLPKGGSDFVREYLNARIYNIISTWGGRKLTFFTNSDEGTLRVLLEGVEKDFYAPMDKRERQRYGRCLNVAERINDMLDGARPGTSRFKFNVDTNSAPGIAADSSSPNHIRSELKQTLANLPESLKGKTVLGMDVGGSDIKVILSIDGKLAACKEYDWFPANFQVCRQLIDPICLMARWARARAASESDMRFRSIRESLDGVAQAHVSDKDVSEAVENAENRLGKSLVGLDGIGICFPDVVVKNKIVGGEVYKTRGIRNNREIDYEKDFRTLTDLNLALKEFCVPRGKVANINDGPMAAFTAAVEMAYKGDSSMDDGIFAHTLGTELGTGWLDYDGSLPEIPLEVYNYVIDLGCRPERQFPSDDPRSLNNFNTGLSGTLQKYVSQSGVFRLAMKYFPENRPDLYTELFDKGFLEESTSGSISVSNHPMDMRKALLEHLMSLPEREGDDTCQRIFREIGEYIGVTWKETQRILTPEARDRILFGRLVKNPVCFKLIQEGAAGIAPELNLAVADDESAWTPLMIQLRNNDRYTVAQFAQAVGAVHYALFDGV